MKKLTIFLCLTAAVTITMAQDVSTTWQKSFSETINWQKVTSLGHYIIGTSGSLMGIDPETGNTIWSTNEFGALSKNQVGQVGNSPLLSINLGSEVRMVDPFNGSIKFDSKKAGLSEIKDQVVLYNTNGILVSGKTRDNKDLLIISSLNNGEIIWKLTEDYGRLITVKEITDNEVLIVTIFHNYRVNLNSGEIVWKNDVSDANAELEKLGAFGGLMKKATSNAAQDINFNVKFYQHPSKDLFYIASEQEGQAQTSGGWSTSSGSGPSFHTTYTAFSTENGERMWKKELDINGKMGELYFHEKGLVVLPDDGQNTKINLYDYETKDGLWGKKGRGLKIKGGIYSYSEIKNGLLLVSQNLNGKNFITYLNTEAGDLPFDKPIKIDGGVVFSENISKGLLYISTEEVNILDIISGDVLLDDPITTVPALTAQNKDMLYAFDTKDNVIKALDKASGTVKVLGTEIEFEGKEGPGSIEIRENGILLSASQNLTLIDFNGQKVFQEYFEAPREPGIIRALRYAQAVRAAYIGAAAYAGAAAFQSAGQEIKEDDEVSGTMAEGIGQAYGELGNAASDFAKQSWQMASARFKATKEADDYIVVLTQQEKNNYLYKVSKVNGTVEGKIDLGKDRDPSYAMDGATGAVFYKTDNSEVVAFKF